MADERRDAMERLLDDALASYSNEEPRPGLEQRILTRVRTESAPPRFLFLKWALPISAAACLLAGIIFWPHSTPAPESPATVQTAVAEPPAAVAPVEPVTPPCKKHRTTPLLARHPALPKRPQFPTPSPLTAEERALVAFVRLAPDQALQAFSDTPPKEIEPIRINEIKIQPLQNGDETE